MKQLGMGRTDFETVPKNHAPQAVPRRYGPHRAVRRAVRAGRAALPQGWRWPPAQGPGVDAAHLPAAAVVQSLRPSRGGGALRLALHAGVYRHRPRRGAGARRDHHLLERHHLGKRLFEQVHEFHEHQGIRANTGTIVDATIISAPLSTKNRERKRDPDMHQTKKGKQWYFRMKDHFGVYSETEVIHAVVATAANVADAHCPADLLHGGETAVWGDSAYQGQTAVIAECAPQAQDLTNRRKGVVDVVERAANRAMSSVRSRVEHSTGVIKRVFAFAKVRYRGLEKNAKRLFVTAALANLYLVRRRLLRMAEG